MEVDTIMEVEVILEEVVAKIRYSYPIRNLIFYVTFNNKKEAFALLYSLYKQLPHSFMMSILKITADETLQAPLSISRASFLSFEKVGNFPNFAPKFFVFQHCE